MASATPAPLATDPCKYANDGVCDVPQYCTRGDFSDCAGETPSRQLTRVRSICTPNGRIIRASNIISIGYKNFRAFHSPHSRDTSIMRVYV
jgi:hypothetical protein